MRRRLVAFALFVGVAGLVSGCGGPMRPDELSRSIQTLESTAAEGAILANDVARDRTKATFARVHARDLGDVAVHEAEKLNDASADRSDVASAKSKAIDLADKIDTALGQIQVAPGDESGARQAQTQLDKLSKQAGDLAGSL
jgi:outer membrane murein-binding lipoprotein Lpp